MKNLLISIFISTLLLILNISNVLADDNKLLLHVASQNCPHGLHSQSNNDYSVFIFCDDALGTNIGIVLTKRGVSPVSSLQPNSWGITNRFWQDGPWCTDVQDVFWSPSGNFLYVATSGIYGDGGLFELDLLNREYARVFPNENDLKGVTNSFYTRIESFDAKAMKATVSLYHYNDKEKKY